MDLLRFVCVKQNEEVTDELYGVDDQSRGNIRDIAEKHLILGKFRTFLLLSSLYRFGLSIKRESTKEIIC